MPTRLQEVVILGAGGHAYSCIDISSRILSIKVIGCLDNVANIGAKIGEMQVIGTDDRILEFIQKKISFVLGVGQIKSPLPRIRLFDTIIRNEGKFENLIATSATVSSTTIMGSGITIMEGARIGPNVRLGDGVIVNTNAVIEHESVIHSFCHISTGAIINGGCEIGRGSFVGSGSITKHKISIGENSIVGMNKTIKVNLGKNSIIK